MAKELADFSLIAKSLTVDGNIQCKGKLIVNGTLRGKVKGEIVMIAESGTVFADIIATCVSIGGKFEGSIRKTKEVIILATGSCTGTIECDSLVVDPGGILNAEIECMKKDSLSNPPPDNGHQ